jgi:Dolichyl-phosphate-mannose-protein mannosyltransferase
MSFSSPSTSSGSPSEKIWWGGLLGATALNCLFQIIWFWRFRSHNINSDGIAYIGLARHLLDGNLKASLHGYWSPLITWIIAVASLFSSNFTLVGRLVTIATFLACLPLLYRLTLRLWRSRVAAALAVFWFSTGRGVIEAAVGSILADFLFTACVLLYFLLLLQALRDNRPARWLWLGAAHGLAFLAKAIAMPWLAISTVLAVLAQNVRSPRRMGASVLLAFLIPAAVWAGWGFTLRTKYSQFTAGYQLRANLMINWTRRLSHHTRGDNLAFVDTSSLYDNYMVGEASWSTLQSFSLRRPGILAMLRDSEIQNLPSAAKEILILLTPGGALALAAMLLLLARGWRQHRPQAAFAGIAVLSAVALIAAYCMLVFDSRYILPITVVLIALSSPALLPSNLAPQAPHAAGWVQKTALGLALASTVFFALYWASPFRTVDRDFEASCYQAASALRSGRPDGTLVSIGNGPYPEHGVGFEAGPYTAYLSGWRLVGGNSELPDRPGADDLAGRAIGANSDAVAVWGSPSNPAYGPIVEALRHNPGYRAATRITDPYKGEVGTLIFLARKT